MDTPSQVAYSEQVTAAVNAAIKAQGQTVLGLSEATGIARVTLMRRLSGHTDFSVGELDRIAEALGVDVRTFTSDAA
jgi:transcriptional regulator with XRE-family HTH domain